MNTPTRLGVYGLGLVVTFAAALGAGRLVGPRGEPVAHDRGAGHTDSGTAATHPPAGATVPGGLQVSDAGYRLDPLTRNLTVGADGAFRFRIIGPDGAALTRYTRTHDKDLHLIVVRRDLSGFRHLHPDLDGDGVWSVPLSVAEAGQYRVFADFRPAARQSPLTLGVDVPAVGEYRPRPLPAAERTFDVDGYRVELSGELIPGASSRLTLKVQRDGVAVTDLQPYLGAYGHLVALRDGDLAYLHVHPDGTPGDGRTAAGPEITFHVEVPSVGAYRLYLDFQHAGVVRTAEFTAVAGAAEGPAQPRTGNSPAGPTPPAPSDAGGHDDRPHGHG